MNHKFQNYTGLTSIVIPSSVTSIGECAFYTLSLKAVVSHIENPLPIEGSTNQNSPFTFNTFLTATLYVPKGAVERYKETDGWKDFASIVEWTGSIDETIGEDPQPTPKCETPTIAFINRKLQLECNTEGMEYHVSITGSNINVTTTEGNIDIPKIYNVKVYASKDGYLDSDEVTTTIQVLDLLQDVNGDGVVDSQDVLGIYQYMQEH